jgi:hypothetical protein
VSAGPTERLGSNRGRLRNLWSVWDLHKKEEVHYVVV